MSKLILSSLCCLAFSMPLFASVLTEAQKVTGSDTTTGDFMGYTVDHDDTTIIVGAKNSNDQAGQAYIFEKDSFGVWQEMQILAPSDGASFELFANNVHLHSDLALIAKTYDSQHPQFASFVYAFERNTSGQWIEKSKFTSNDIETSDNFGESIDYDGSLALVGALSDDYNGLSYAGSAYVFENNGSNQFNQRVKLVPSDPASDKYFGYSVALQGDRAFVSAPYDDNNGYATGAVYVFKKNKRGKWRQEAKIIANDAHATDLFGYSITASDNQLFISAPFHVTDNSNYGQGAVYVYENQKRKGWVEVDKILLPIPGASGIFGASVDVDNDKLVVGAMSATGSGGQAYAGAAYYYKQSNNGAWVFSDSLIASDPMISDHLGKSVSINNGSAVVGAYSADSSTVVDTGAVYIFDNLSQ